MLAATNDASAGLVAHWKLNDGSGTIAKDSVGGNDGILIGDNDRGGWCVRRGGGTSLCFCCSRS